MLYSIINSSENSSFNQGSSKNISYQIEEEIKESNKSNIYQKMNDNKLLSQKIKKSKKNKNKIPHNFKNKHLDKTWIKNDNILFNNKRIQIKKINENKESKEPKDSISKKSIHSSESQEKREGFYSSRNYFYKGKRPIPRILSFTKIPLIEKENISSNIYLNQNNYSEFIDIPRSEYGSFVGTKITYFGNGMETGEYKFKGSKIILQENQNEEQKIEIDEESILKEIDRRKNKAQKLKRARYELLDRFYATTEFDGKPVTKILNKTQNQKIYQQEIGKENFYISFNNYRNKSFDNKLERIDKKNDNREWKKIQNFKINSYKNYAENFRYKTAYIMNPKDNYSKYLYEQINKIRNDPKSYIQVIKNEINNMRIDSYGRLIYNGKIKLELNEGVAAFNNAINYLENIKPMDKLQFNELLTIQIPKNEYDIKDENYMKNKVDNIIYNGFIIKSFWREIIKEPEICFLIMIIDEIKRNDILNPNMKYIGVTSHEINGNFVCFITLGE